KHVAQSVIQRLWDGGHLTLGTYSGWYSVPDETFFRTEDTVELDGDHYIAAPSEDQSRAPLEWVEETSHFFKLSAFEEVLKEYYAEHPETLQPDARRNEALSFISSGLRDASISRELEWGIPIPAGVPHAENHSIYVWFEALMNYLSAPGYRSEDAAQRERFKQLWPPDLQLMSKDIFTRFHATLWPSMLTALELPLPKQLFAHGFWTVDGRKMSKRDPETIVEPLEFANEIAAKANCEFTTAVDALRYYCLREVTFGADGDFSREGCITRYNSDLANGFGNLVNRALSMLAQYFESIVPESTTEYGLKTATIAATANIATAYENLDYSGALNAVWEVISLANRVIEEQKPWAKIKSGEREAVASLLVELLAVCHWCSVVLAPVMPHVAARLIQLLAFTDKPSWEAACDYGLITTGHACNKPEPLFPRIAVAAIPPQKPRAEKPRKETVMSITDDSSAGTPANAVPADNATPVEAPVPAPENTPGEATAPNSATAIAATAPAEVQSNLIEYADFAKVELR
ncbi:MAG TPA: class I tRNA ligase family protein, partial [Abditibacteriaceae bacterium]